MYGRVVCVNGIVAFGAHVPRHSLDRAAISAALGHGGGRGTRSVASYDEDSTSMGVEAARAALWVGAQTPASVHFATTAPAYADKTNATTVHAALGLPTDVFASDCGASVRSAIGALRAAAGDGGLAVVSDVRLGRPGSADEAGGGDGAAAFLFGTGDAVVAEELARTSATAEFLDRWRTPGSWASSTWEERFGLGEYLPLIEDAASRALAQAGIERPDHVIVASPHTRAAATAAAPFGAAGADELEAQLGYLGAAHAGLRLVDVLERAQPEESILVVNAADGADAFIFRTTAALSRRPRRLTVREQAALARPIDYATFLTWRGVLEREPPRRPDPVRPEGPPAARAVGWKFALQGSRCTKCKRVHVPPTRVCAGCGAIDAVEPAPFADLQGTISTYTIDRLAYSLSPPTITAVVDFDEGGRLTCELTDCAAADVNVGTRVDLSFRRMFTAQGVHNYFWKARPLINGTGKED
jgi:hydroxymethylglutaryl-CoA synthase